QACRRVLLVRFVSRHAAGEFAFLVQCRVYLHCASSSSLPLICSFWFYRPSVEKPPNRWVRGSPLYTTLNSLGWMNSSLNHGNFAGLKASTSQSIMCRTLGMRPLPG